MKRKNWLKRLLAAALAAFITVSALGVAAMAADTEETLPPEQAQTEEFTVPEDAIYLSTAEDLLALAENCVSDAWSRDKVVVLSNDIDLTGTDFAGIPTFGGRFLGQGHTVSGLRLNRQQNAQGFFRYLQKTAVVEELHLSGTVLPAKDGNAQTGGLVGVNSGTVRNCSFNGRVSGNEQTGGIAGVNRVSGVIEGCTVSGVISGDHYTGGIAGENAGVVRSCVNHAQINTHVDHNSVSVGGMTLDSITGKESLSDATNIGGIAGTSTGVIRSCENRAAVGYEKMGYNVGGIAGSQIGYITDCANYAAVNGSNGVGGIVGQFKPNVALEFGENLMSEMMDQMIAMMGSMNSMMGSMNGMMEGMDSDMEQMQEALDALGDMENMDPDELNAALNAFSDAFNGLYDSMAGSGSQMTGQMSGMMASMTGMVQTMEQLNEGMEVTIVDISREDTPENTLTKVNHCANYGRVSGEYYVGGIAGIADIEDTTAQEEITGQVNFSNEGEVVMRLVIRDCRNTGTVSAAKAYAGGITGYMTIGAIFGGMNTGSIDALSADYVGGIAGSSQTYITGSFSRSILSGGSYVGGIAGYGAEVTGCYAVSDIAAATRFAGGILGHTDPLPDGEAAAIADNHYLLAGENLGGIDGISYEGATAPMDIAEFLAVEGLDELFRTVSIRFVVAGQEDTVLTVRLGEDLPVAKIPVLDVGEHEQYQWQLIPAVTDRALTMGETAQVSYISTERLSNILFDQTYEAVFDAKNMVIASENVAPSGRPLALAVGAFDQETKLSLTDRIGEENRINGAQIVENWQVSMADIGIEKLHYLIPEGMDPEQTVLYVKNISGNWEQRSFTVEGSYLIFFFTHGESGFALGTLPEEEFPVAAVAVTAAALAVLWIVGTGIKKRSAKKKGAAVEK